MAIYPDITPQAHPNHAQAPSAPIGSTNNVIGTSPSLAIPLDGSAIPKENVAFSVSQAGCNGDSGTRPQRKLVRRDSLERREALLKGKEGSRQRRRWENGLTAYVAPQTSFSKC